MALYEATLGGFMFTQKFNGSVCFSLIFTVVVTTTLPLTAFAQGQIEPAANPNLYGFTPSEEVATELEICVDTVVHQEEIIRKQQAYIEERLRDFQGLNLTAKSVQAATRKARFLVKSNASKKEVLSALREIRRTVLNLVHETRDQR